MSVQENPTSSCCRFVILHTGSLNFSTLNVEFRRTRLTKCNSFLPFFSLSVSYLISQQKVKVAQLTRFVLTDKQKKYSIFSKMKLELSFETQLYFHVSQFVVFITPVVNLKVSGVIFKNPYFVSDYLFLFEVRLIFFIFSVFAGFHQRVGS